MDKYIILAILGLAGVVAYFMPAPIEDKSRTIADAIQRRHELVSLTTTRNVEVTSVYERMGMRGELVTTAPIEYQWTVDLSKVEVRKVGETYHVRMPDPVRSAGMVMYSKVRHYNNGSFLFFSRDIERELTDANMAQIDKMAGEKDGNKELARENARDDILGLLGGFGVAIVLD